MISYSPAPSGHETLLVVDEMIAAYHPDLQRHGVTIGVDLAHVPHDETLKAKGKPCHAYIRITKTRERQRGFPDALITVDYTYYMTLTPGKQAGLIDHEIAHVLVWRDTLGKPDIDADGRPELELRQHDLEFGWFMDVAARHGEDSHEVMQARSLQEQHGQLLFSFAEGPFHRPAIEASSRGTTVTIEAETLDKIVEATKTRRPKGKSSSL